MCVQEHASPSVAFYFVRDFLKNIVYFFQKRCVLWIKDKFMNSFILMMNTNQTFTLLRLWSDPTLKTNGARIISHTFLHFSVSTREYCLSNFPVSLKEKNTV